MRLISLLTAAAAVAPVPAAGRDLAFPPVSEVVVTAARTADPLNETPATVAVIDAERIRAVQAVFVAELLAQVPGVGITRNGGPGGATQVRIRGAEAEQTVLLIDGVKLNDPASTGGGYDFRNLTAGDADRIEVLRGPQSTLWGGQAIGGVVQVLTRTPHRSEGRLTLEGGSRDTALARISGGTGGAWGGVRLSAAQFTTSGFSAFSERRGGREADGHRNTAVSGRADLNLTPDLRLDLRLSGVRGRTEVDAVGADTAEFVVTREAVGYAGLNLGAPGGALNQRLGASYTQTDRDNRNLTLSTPRTFDARGLNQRLDYQADWRINPQWRLTLGAETERSALRTASPTPARPNPVPVRRAVRLDGAYVQVKAAPAPGLVLTAGARRDEHGVYGGAETVQAGLVYARGPARVRLNYAEGFKAPSLFQLYSQFGNPALSPETARGWDAGAEGAWLDGRISAGAVYFRRDSQDQIEFANCAGAQCLTNPNGIYVNLSRTRAEGVELSAQARPTPALNLSATATALKTQNRAPGADFGKTLPRRPERSAYFEAAYSWPGGGTAAAAVRYAGESFDNAANTFRIKSHTVLDLRAAWPLRPDLDLYGRIENVTDAAYETIRRYGTPGRGAFIGVRARF